MAVRLFLVLDVVARGEGLVIAWGHFAVVGTKESEFEGKVDIAVAESRRLEVEDIGMCKAEWIQISVAILKKARTIARRRSAWGCPQARRYRVKKIRISWVEAPPSKLIFDRLNP